MCCRYLLEESPELRPIIEAMNRSPLAGEVFPRASLRTAGEIRPADIAPVLARSRERHNLVVPMKWGFSGKSLLINARTETAAEKPTFRECWERRRCIVPASWYFEWEHFPDKGRKTRVGDKYAIRPKNSEMTWLCGLYRIEEGLPAFVVLTREPGEGIRFIHDRMPLILPKRYTDDWIRPDTKPEKLLDMALTDMVFENLI